MLKFKSQEHSPKTGFTIVELLIIAPIVILTIGAFISVIVSMTGEVLATRSANALAYNIQDALNRIEEDAKLSTTFLEANHVSLTSPQGYNDDAATNFANVGANGNMLILNTIATTGNPLSSTSGLVYLANKPNACASTQVGQNTPMTTNVVYFVKNNTLWRRSVMPADYLTAGCSVPWQQPSCAPGKVATMCKTQDVRLLDGINPTDFTIQYFDTADSTTANDVASNSDTVAVPPSDRYAALQAATTIGTTINMTKTTAGRDISQAGTIRVTKLSTNASIIATVVPDVIPIAPTVAASISDPASAVFTWPTVPGATSYSITYNTGSGWVNGFTNGAATTYTVDAVRNNVVTARVTANNSAGASPYIEKSITIPPWTSLFLQNSWNDYLNGYSTGAYTKTSSGVVMLKGLLRRTGTAVGYEIVGALPVGYRPAGILIFQTSMSPNEASRVDVYPDGTVRCAVCNAGWTALDGIKFLPTGSPYPFTAPVLSNLWVNYDTGVHQVAGYAVDGNGRTHIQGLVKSGTVTNGTLIATLPIALLPGEYMHLPADNGSVYGVVGIEYRNPYGAVAKGGTNGYLSLTNMFYPASYLAGTNCAISWCALTLQNGWYWYGTIFSTPKYTKSADGIVSLKGLIGSGTVTNGTIIATLPVGYRPKEHLLLGVASANAYARIDIMPATGTVIVGGSVAAGWLSIDGINFMAEQ